ncbi:class D beta-lactamase [Alkalicaulis satelles]|uniref:Beta-lactamase n=1 Tax=Alkalicaulis satelles TaxID=2609175 RepID=A0A5M6ZK66_9PROT|nr:class D beta-lactamase [Alkalicaulis satelles]KAA5805216.1 class D beta-lactamase [Alkalicaulis satelles]
MRRLRTAVLTGVLMAVLLAWPAKAQELDSLLDEAGVTGAIVVIRASDGRAWTGGGERVDARFIPASTFKIPNSLILLQSGVVSGPDAALAWDGTERPFASWNQDQTFAQAFQRSTVWAYQAWTLELDRGAMQAALEALDYGNGDAGGAPDRFWLDGPLEISAREQAGFLSRLHARALPFEAGVMETVIDLMALRRGEGWVLRGKTGWRFGGEPDTGWFAGWLELEGEAWLFALNIDMPDPPAQLALRARLAEAALQEVSGWTPD